MCFIYHFVKLVFRIVSVGCGARFITFVQIRKVRLQQIMVLLRVNVPRNGVTKTDRADAQKRLETALPKSLDNQVELPHLSRVQFLRFRQQFGLYIKALHLNVVIPETEETRTRTVKLNTHCKNLGIKPIVPLVDNFDESMTTAEQVASVMI